MNRTSQARSARHAQRHDLGGDGDFLVRDRLVDMAEKGGYIVIRPLGYNVSGWNGSPVIAMGGGPAAADPAELSEKDVMKESGMEGAYLELEGADHGTVIGTGMPDIYRLSNATVKRR